MDVSVIILTWNSKRYIKKCVESFLPGLIASGRKVEVFIVDNGSNDGTIRVIENLKARYPDNIEPILLDHNNGTTYPRNLVLRRAQGDYMVIMDSDVEAPEWAIERLIDIIDSDESTGLAAPRLCYPNGSTQKSIDDFPTVQTKLFRYFFLKLIESINNKQATDSNIREVDYAISALWVFKRELIEKVGLLDENIFYAPEDVDYCLRIWKKGYKVLYVPEVSVIHDAQEISRGMKFNTIQRSHIKGLYYLFRKHKYFFKRPDLRYLNKK